MCFRGAELFSAIMCTRKATLFTCAVVIPLTRVMLIGETGCKALSISAAAHADCFVVNVATLGNKSASMAIQIGALAI